MSPAYIRANRIRQLHILFKQRLEETKDPQVALEAVFDRAHHMASKRTADEYVQEVIRRVSK